MDRIAIESSEAELGPDGQVRVDEELRTNVPHVFAAGDVIGRETLSQMATPDRGAGASSPVLATRLWLGSQPPRTRGQFRTSITLSPG
jgi:hypothetical protein